jgi:hypothetical protein
MRRELRGCASDCRRSSYRRRTAESGRTEPDAERLGCTLNDLWIPPKLPFTASKQGDDSQLSTVDDIKDGCHCRYVRSRYITLYAYPRYPRPTRRARYRPADIVHRSRAGGQRLLDCRASRISVTGTRSPHRTQADRAMRRARLCALEAEAATRARDAPNPALSAGLLTSAALC